MTYDEIGHSYARHRRADPRIAATLHRALGDPATVLNVGAGTGSYEPDTCAVTAIEPSRVMTAQRAPSNTTVIDGVAEDLPFSPDTFDAAMAVLTVHHWSDWTQGVQEMLRVARRVVLLTWDPGSDGFWLTREYFPTFLDRDRAIFPSIDDLRSCLGGAHVETVPIPFDCTDGFLGAYWRRPEAYLDPSVRAGISCFRDVAPDDPALVRLEADVSAGHWRARHARLHELQELDVGYRVIIGESRA